MKTTTLKTLLLGTALGDALGVPVEFTHRHSLKENPVTNLRKYGTHHQPRGTWSDDTSLSLCLAESITEGLDVNLLALKFINWYHNNYWTPRGWVFDIGIGTRQAIGRLAEGIESTTAGGTTEMDNGNGSLMRILPLIVHTQNLPITERFDWTRKISSITHGHIRSITACFYYLEFAKKIIEGTEKKQAYHELQQELPPFLSTQNVPTTEIEKFNRLLREDITQVEEDQIQSSGYVIHSLEASIWCFLTTNNYTEAVLKAVNLGHDTDTTGAITGGLAALNYGLETLPQDWINELARLDDIIALCNNLKK